MKTRQLLALTTLTLFAPILLNSTSAGLTARPSQGQGRAFADPAFERVWTRTDSLVATGAVRRSWYWGPQPNTGQVLEEYAEGPGGQHLVQYFDKSRMEINNPDADPTSPFYVTNGLLTRELISGYLQTGDNKFVFRYPANIPVAGDRNGGGITYASLGYVVEQEAENEVGRPVTETLKATGYLASLAGAEAAPPVSQSAVKYAYYEPATRHNIPNVFWEFLNATGPVVESGKQTTAPINVPYFYATGYPVSEAFWISIVVRGRGTLAMLQVYERRVLTYVPDDPEGFRVQMGNVGQHYYDWRYKGAGKPSALANDCNGRAPVRGFAKVYNENEVVKARLNCIFQEETSTTVGRQTFEHGQMLSVTLRESYRGVGGEDVYVLFEDGRVQTFHWAERDGLPDTPQGVPAGRYAPSGAFLKVWEEHDLRSRLGWATAPADVQKNGPGTQVGGLVAYFDGGLMVYPNLAIRQIYVLYAANGNTVIYGAAGRAIGYYHADHWLVFDDTFTGN
jgi:hypothetical protein